MRFTSAQIVEATGGMASGTAEGSVCWDTRANVSGAWYVALVGDRFDGHAYVEDALAHGAVGVIVSDVGRVPTGATHVVVADTTRAIQALALAGRRTLAAPVVAVTGSSGKTTTRTLVGLALSPLGAVHTTHGNLNNHWGVPMTLLQTPATADAVVLEMGTSSPGEIAVLADIGEPNVRIVVNVGPAHLEELGGLEGVAVEKTAMYRSAGPSDTLVVNVDDPFLAPFAGDSRAVTWGRDSEARFRLDRVDIDPATWSQKAHYDTPEGWVEVCLPTLGEHVAHNAGAALAAAHACGVPVLSAAAALARYEPVGMRQRVEALPGGIVAINDAYNANPASMRASLGVLASLPGRRVAVLGDMMELGPDELSWHRDVARDASTVADLVVLVGSRMAEVAPDVAPGAWVGADATSLARQLAAWLESGDHVLFKASRGVGLERVLDALRDELGAMPRGGGACSTT